MKLKRNAKIDQTVRAQTSGQAQNRKPASRSQKYIAPSTPTQKKIALIWKELLGIEEISINDHLFRLGGHSIMAMQILGRIHQLFQVELNIAVIYTTSFTIAELARLVDEQVILQADQGDVAAILMELDSLSDDEVKAMLEEQSKDDIDEDKA